LDANITVDVSMLRTAEEGKRQPTSALPAPLLS
jgi:hypothetical protein